MLKKVWPKEAGPRKVWPLTPQEAAQRRQETEAEKKKRVLTSALASMFSLPPFVS
jgi:hypothetical protein